MQPNIAHTTIAILPHRDCTFVELCLTTALRRLRWHLTSAGKTKLPTAAIINNDELFSARFHWSLNNTPCGEGPATHLSITINALDPACHGVVQTLCDQLATEIERLQKFDKTNFCFTHPPTS